ncbi:MAG: hypothetical protein V2A79_19770 [Planctomycetota bacterium]
MMTMNGKPVTGWDIDWPDEVRRCLSRTTRRQGGPRLQRPASRPVQTAAELWDDKPREYKIPQSWLDVMPGLPAEKPAKADDEQTENPYEEFLP